MADRRRQGGCGAAPEPIVLITRQRSGQAQVVQCCARGEAVGIYTGMSVAHARALAGGRPVHAAEDRPWIEAAMLQRLARWAVRFSPVVAVDQPDGLLIDISGTRRLFGSEPRLVQRISRALRRAGFTSHCAVAETAWGARALARYDGRPMVIIEDGQLLEPLRQLPVAALGIEADDVAALAELGVERIGELLQLDRAALADRFGHAIGRRLDQAMGAMPEVLDGVHPTEPIYAEQRFDGPVRQYEAIEQTARRLLKELADQLAQRESGARRLVLRFGQVDRHISQVVVQLSRPGRDMKHLWRLMSLRLETLRLTDAVEWISLRAESVGRIVHQQRGTTWWETEQTQRSGGLQAIAQWLDVARHRLGTGRVVRAEPIAGYIPERAYRWQPARIDSPARQHRHPGQPVTVDEDRPSVLWHPPRPVEVMALSPGGPPVRLQWERQWKDIICSIGPRRIAGPWWEEPEGNSWIRDYYRAQDAGGQWWWLYRQAETGSWFAHGQWA